MGSAMTVATEATRAAATAKNFIVVVGWFGWFVGEEELLLLMDTEDALMAVLYTFSR